MNSFNTIGFFIKDPVMSQLEDKKKPGKFIKYTTFVLAVKDRGATDFPTYIAWRGVAKNIVDFCKKGDQIGFNGKIKTGDYEKDGVKKYYTNLKVENIDFIGDRKVTRVSTLPNEQDTEYTTLYLDDDDGINY